MNKKRNPKLCHARLERNINSDKINSTMPKMLRPQSTINTRKMRSAKDEFPRDIRNLRTSETSLRGASGARSVTETFGADGVGGLETRISGTWSVTPCRLMGKDEHKVTTLLNQMHTRHSHTKTSKSLLTSRFSIHAV